ncbi:type II toxin-antitoxin system Phd/YefM family antitoxin [candidate division KSB1 bacterium]|nr:type II toxin-antitoxin system Phd/YefM family antitoxin [bacterium]NUM66473.1 type II toxin-antitoxin system Phd/YefM family antitoxin [candidate division KSB1 bacterium]
MQSIAVSDFRANLMQVLKQIERGQEIAITSRGREIARLVPPTNAMEKAREKLVELRQTAVVFDVVSPIADEWEASR